MSQDFAATAGASNLFATPGNRKTSGSVRYGGKSSGKKKGKKSPQSDNKSPVIAGDRIIR